ncbi:MAG TPA: hypothetical protein VFQ53_38925 [Kofleriaceae bacterium]|nr:hypothetical protein [Kofleriaceae bacterium]
MRAVWWLFPLVTGCATDEASTAEHASALTAEVRQARAALIRDSAAEMGVHNAALLGGIAISETNLAHCWSEATYACKGPASPSCDGGPIIAGAADGPCSDEQGGLGMFQFDAGTYSQTISTYTDSILTVEGNTAQAVAFVVDKVILDIDGVNDWQAAVDWINSIPMRAGDPLADRWGRLMACRYNGCCSDSSLCTSRAAGYRDNAIDLYAELGAEFWATADRCAAIPDGGVIDQRTECYVAAGEPRYWRREASGFGDDREWTGTTAAGKPSNYAQWLLRPARATTYTIEAYVTGGEATAASYEIHHAGMTDTVMIDQAAQSGFVTLGDFELTGDGSEYVLLGDNTGTADQKLVYDALRVTATDGSDGNGGGDDLGNCSTGGRASFGAIAAVVALVLRRRRR